MYHIMDENNKLITADIHLIIIKILLRHEGLLRDELSYRL